MFNKTLDLYKAYLKEHTDLFVPQNTYPYKPFVSIIKIDFFKYKKQLLTKTFIELFILYYYITISYLESIEIEDFIEREINRIKQIHNLKKKEYDPENKHVLHNFIEAQNMLYVMSNTDIILTVPQVIKIFQVKHLTSINDLFLIDVDITVKHKHLIQEKFIDALTYEILYNIAIKDNYSLIKDK